MTSRSSAGIWRITAIINPIASSAALVQKPPVALATMILTLLGRGQIDVVHVIARLRDDAQIGKLLQQRAGKARSLAVRHQRVEAPQHGRIAERLREDFHLGALAQSAHAGRPIVGAMSIVKNCDTHV